MNKICTTVEQSKKLIELGIDINTADMMWDDWSLIDEGWKLSTGYYPEIEKDYGRKCYPAWSLSALLELVPYPLLSKLSNGLWKCVCFQGTYELTTSNSSINAAFEMVCWLLENKKI